MDILIFILAVLSWLLLAALRAVRISPSDISEFELVRRSKKQDEAAAKLLDRDGALPDVRALGYVVEVFVFVVLIALLISGYGTINGIVLTFVALLLLQPASQLQRFADAVQRLYETHEPRIIEYALKLHVALKWLQIHGVVPIQRVHSKEEFIHLAKQSDHIFNNDELRLLEHGLAFQGKTVAEVMTPKSVIDFAENTEVIGPIVLDRLHKTGHSRFPVIKQDIDHVVGVLYMHDLVQIDKKHRTVADAMRTPVFYVREDQTLEHALHAFLRTHHHLFVVVNKYRETVGLLALEDVLESLLGRKIVDEFDAFDDLRAVAETNPRANNSPDLHENI